MAKKRSRPNRLAHSPSRLERYSEKNHAMKYVTALSTRMTATAQGFTISSGTRYPGTTSPDRTQPRRKLKKATTKTPTHTVVITEPESAPCGKIVRKNSFKTFRMYGRSSWQDCSFRYRKAKADFHAGTYFTVNLDFAPPVGNRLNSFP